MTCVDVCSVLCCIPLSGEDRCRVGLVNANEEDGSDEDISVARSSDVVVIMAVELRRRSRRLRVPKRWMADLFMMNDGVMRWRKRPMQEVDRCRVGRIVFAEQSTRQRIR